MRQRAGVGVAVGVWQTILPVLSRPLISVTGPVICTAGSSWHFLSQRQYARAHIQPLIHADTHGGTQLCTPVLCVPSISKRHKGTLQRCPQRKNTLTQQLAYLCTQEPAQSRANTHPRCSQGTCPWSHINHRTVLRRERSIPVWPPSKGPLLTACKGDRRGPAAEGIS